MFKKLYINIAEFYVKVAQVSPTLCHPTDCSPPGSSVQGILQARYTRLNTEFQRIARRDKKVFLKDQCKEIEENNRMGQTRDLYKKIRDTKGTFHAKMGSIKDTNGVDLPK